MNLNFLSGLLLIIVVIATVLFLIKELIGDSTVEHDKARNPLARALELLSGGEAEPINEHLIGSIGKVISHSGDDARPMRVRLGPESWPARMHATEEDALPVGDAVEVVAIDGAVVVVKASGELVEAPNGG
jgi:hypothetical protein